MKGFARCLQFLLDFSDSIQSDPGLSDVAGRRFVEHHVRYPKSVTMAKSFPPVMSDELTARNRDLPTQSGSQVADNCRVQIDAWPRGVVAPRLFGDKVCGVNRRVRARGFHPADSAEPEGASRSAFLASSYRNGRAAAPASRRRSTAPGARESLAAETRAQFSSTKMSRYTV